MSDGLTGGRLLAVDKLFICHLFGEIGTPTATNSPLCNRIELISKDGQCFWVHKDVLAFNSDAFRQMFDPDKPDDAKFKYLREGKMTLENVSGGALKELLTYVYLKHVTPDFEKFAKELVPLSEMYELQGLKLLCAEQLTIQTKNEKNDIGKLLSMLDVSRLHKLRKLEAVCVDRLESIMQAKNYVDRGLILKVTKEAHKHGYNLLKLVCQQKLKQLVIQCPNLTVSIMLELAAAAEKYGLNDLLLACSQWLVRNFQTARSSGQFDHLMEDKTDGLITRLLAFGINKM